MVRFIEDKMDLFFHGIWAALVLAFVWSLLQAQWINVLVSAITFVLTLAPIFLQRTYKIHIPKAFSLLIVFFVFASLVLGEIGNFYERLWWWDILLHGVSALGLGLVGVVMLLTLYSEEKIKAQPFLLSVFAFSFAVAIGALWEIVEFSLDQLPFLDLNLQKSGLIDTMWDLIVDVVGAFVAALAGYLYMIRKRSIYMFSNLIHEMVTRNSKKKELHVE